MFDTLYRKMAAVLFGLVLLMGLAFFLLVGYSADMYQQEVAQKLNTALAHHIVEDEALLTDRQVNHDALKGLFHNLMVINPSIELYLLDPTGKILAFSAPPGRVKRDAVSLAPIQRFLAGGASYPLLGDDPRDWQRHKAFSAAVIPGANGRPEGYLYVILGGEAYDSVTARIKDSYILRFTSAVLLAGLALALVAGLTGFALLTRRLRLLSTVMLGFRQQRSAKLKRFPLAAKARDEIDQLGESFNQMADRIDRQVEALQQTDAKRREMVANVSHDLRTPLTSLHGYLETLLLKDDTLTAEERRRYLEIANTQSQQLTQLVAELFELAKLDSCETLLNIEPFSLAELAQDVAQKFQLDAEARGIRLTTEFGTDLPFAYGDIGLMQRVLDNLIENALRHTPAGGHITLSLNANPDKLTVKVADNGYGIPADDLPHIFDRFYRLEKSRGAGAGNAGLGLAIVKRILELHGSKIFAASQPQHGTTFTFQLATYHAA
jgi:two-component system OmpR family sensor kinase